MFWQKLNEFLTNNKALQFFHLLRQGVTILIAIFLAKSSLNTEEIGVFELLLYLGYTFSFFWIAGLIQGLLTTFNAKEPEQQKKIYTNAYLLFAGFSILIFLFLWFGETWVLQIFTGRTELPYYHLFILYFLFNLPTYLLENFYLLSNRPLKIVLFGLFSFGIHFLVVLIPVFLGWGLLWSFYGLTALAVVKHFWLLLFLFGEGKFALDLPYLKEWGLLSLPLIGYAFIAGFNQSFGAWLVNFEYNGDEEIFAIFRYGARELPLAMAMASAFNAVMLPEVVKNSTEAVKMIKIKSLKLLHLLYPVSIVLMLTSHLLFPIVFNVDFESSAIIFNVFLLVIVSRLIFPQTILIGLKANNAILVISIFEFIFNILISFILIRYLGLIGVALGTVIAYVVEKVLLCWYLNHRFKIALPEYVNLKWLAFYTAMLIGSFFISFGWH